MDKMQLIIKREFEKAHGDAIVANVEFMEDETIVAVTWTHGTWSMAIGSDDDQFIFCRDDRETDEIVAFPFPTDWLDAVNS